MAAFDRPTQSLIAYPVRRIEGVIVNLSNHEVTLQGDYDWVNRGTNKTVSPNCIMGRSLPHEIDFKGYPFVLDSSGEHIYTLDNNRVGIQKPFSTESDLPRCEKKVTYIVPKSVAMANPRRSDLVFFNPRVVGGYFFSYSRK